MDRPSRPVHPRRPRRDPPVMPASADPAAPVAAERQEADGHEQQGSLHDRAELRRDAQGSAGRGRPDSQVAQEERRERNTRHAERPERRHDDPRVPVTGREPPVSRYWMPATSLTPASPAIAPLTSAVPSSVRPTLMPANRAARGLRPTARTRSPVGVRRSTYQATSDDTQCEHEAQVQPRALDELREFGRRHDARRFREAGDRIAPGTVEQAVHEEERDRVEEERRHDLVDLEPDAQDRGNDRPGRAADRAAGDHQRQGERWPAGRRRPGRCPPPRSPRPGAGPRPRCSSSPPGRRSPRPHPSGGSGSRRRGPRGS